MNLAEIADDYIKEYREAAQRELRYHANQRSLGDAIREASFPGGKKHPHQYRIPPPILAAAERALQRETARIGKASSFSDLHACVEGTIGFIRGIGPLAIYDITHRIGAFLRLVPEFVYLHTGARDGARALGVQGVTANIGQLPKELNRLSAAEIEDLLCIYKADLYSLRGVTSRSALRDCHSDRSNNRRSCSTRRRPRLQRLALPSSSC
ncbi:MAG: hypothetical protein ACREHE_07125 [Rhizomicrobium sp.]